MKKIIESKTKSFKYWRQFLMSKKLEKVEKTIEHFERYYGTNRLEEEYMLSEEVST